MKKLFISLLFLLSASFMFADTLYVFVPSGTGNRNDETGLFYRRKIFRNIKHDHRAGVALESDSFWEHEGFLYVYYNGKLYRYNCQWYSEPDEE